VQRSLERLIPWRVASPARGAYLAQSIEERLTIMTQLNQILCPVDFSDLSRRALDHAFAIARSYASTVTALHVVPPAPVVIPTPYYFGAEVAPPMVLPPTDRGTVEAELQRFVASEQVPGLRVDTLVAEAPQPYAEILVQADRLRSDLIVLGTHGRSGFERLFLGSVTEKVLRKSARPVMTVPPKTPDAMPLGPAAFTRILCAIDFSDSSKLALDYAISLARKNGAALTLTHVLETRPLYADFAPAVTIDIDAWTREARARLHAMVPDAARASVNVTEIVHEGKPYREILQLAKTLDVDLILLGVRGRGAADMFFFGSTTHHVIREARCAVLTLRG
jgi:nucleotide-binding universal stress UspA family protein